MRTLIRYPTIYQPWLMSHICPRLISPIAERIIDRNYSKKLFRYKNDVDVNSDDSHTDYTPCHLRIIGNGAEGVPKSVLFSTHKNSYIFNVGDGIQRIIREHSILLRNVKHIFCTYSNWENVGGLLPLLLTMQSVFIENVTVHAPVDMKPFCDMSSLFINLHCLKVKTEACKRNEYFTDQSLFVQYVILDANKHLLSAFTEPKLPKDNKNNNSEWPTENLSFKIKSVQTAVAFICRTTALRPVLDLGKCVDKGVPPGPLLVKLQDGIDITLPNGMTVTAKEVMTKQKPAAVFIVVECPTIDFLDSLVNEESFKMYHESNICKEKYILKYVIHFTPSDVMEDQRYQEWMKRFSIKTQHINVNDHNKCTGCVDSHQLQHALHSVDPELHPLLLDDSIPIAHYDFADVIFSRTRQNAPSGSKHTDALFPGDKLSLQNDTGNTLRTFELRDPDKTEIVNECLPINPNHFTEKLTENRNLNEKFDLMKMQITQKWKQNAIENSADEYPIITFLGTGSAFAARFRNVSGILISLNHSNHMILDCGEGTYGQLVRHFGVKRAIEIISETKLIFISHIHVDHHLGFITLLKKRREALQKLKRQFEKLYLFAPATMMSWFRHYHQHFEDILDDFTFVSNHNLEYRSSQRYYWREKLNEVIDLTDIKTGYVLHCHLSFGISFTMSNGRKITYSGDTMPTKELIIIGKNSTVLIHEATYDDKRINDAKQKLHSTCSEAIDAGKLMKAKYVILTHFSQRYPFIPVLREGCPENVGIAFDNMRVTMNSLPRLGSLYPVFRFLFYTDLEKNRLR